MEGLEAAVVNSSQLSPDLRYEAQFFSKRYLAEDQALHRHKLKSIGEIAFVTDGPHGYHEVDETAPTTMLTAKSTGNWFANPAGADKVADWVVKANKRSLLAIDDVVLSTRGTVGNCAIVTEETLPAIIDQDVARICVNDDAELIPQFVVAYLNSRYGQDHIARHSSGMVQQGMSLAKVRDIPVPILGGQFQERVKIDVLAALDLRRAGRRLMTEAENQLVQLLGFADWMPPEPLTYTARASDVFGADRIDAQYFRPLFSDVEARLRATGHAVDLGTVLTTNSRGKQPLYEPFGLPVVNSKHVRTHRVILEDNRTAVEEGSPVIIKNGDVLLNGTGVGTIGRAATYLHKERALPDNHVTVLRTDAVDPIYLSVFLNSSLGQWQIERHIKGSSGQVELYPGDIAKIVIWVAPELVQHAIRDAIVSAFDRERRANNLLKATERAVEIAIETGELAAMAYLDETEVTI